MAEFFERARGDKSCYREDLIFWGIQGICTLAGLRVGGWGLGDVGR